MTDSGKGPRVVLSGYYGFANAGDEAILQATVAGIRRIRGDARVTILSSDPASSTALTGEPAVDRYQPSALRMALCAPGVLVSGGGSLFQDATSWRSLLYYLAVPAFARWRGMRTMVYAQGLGPLHSRSGRALARWLLARVDRITVRDEASATLLAELGLPGRAVVTADPVFALSPAPVSQARAILQAEGISPGEPLIAVSVRPWPTMGEASRQALARALDGAAMGAGARVLIVCLHPADDPAAAADLACRLSSPCTVLGQRCSPAEMASVIGQARALVAMRLHALIFGAISGVPATALTYDPKIDAIALQLGLGPAHDVAAIDSAALEADIEATLDAPPHRRDEIRQTASHYRSRAEENFRILEELLL